MQQQLRRPVWAEVNLDNLAHNIREVRRVTKADAMVTAVIKADGYGHGAVEIGKTLLENGADRFAVATLTEAIQLRKAYKDVPILVLGYTPEEDSDEVIRHNLIQTVYAFEQAEALDRVAKENKVRAKVHIKLDTGMGRLGLRAEKDAAIVTEYISKLGNVEIEGIYTHFAVADEVNKEYTLGQVKKYNAVIEELEGKGINIPIKHVSNSAAIIDLPEMNYNMVRAGIMLYGLYPSHDVSRENVKLKEVMSLKARISHVKDVGSGVGVSYGLLYTTEHDTRIGTIPLGYADGYTRLYTGNAKAIVSGEIRPIIGRICMDQCMVDLTGLDVQRGDEITMFGPSDDKHITIDEVASWIDTINYEVVCMISKRVPRVYKTQGEIIQIKDALLVL